MNNTFTFCEDTNTKINFYIWEHGVTNKDWKDNLPRNRYEVKVSRNDKSRYFTFWDSAYNYKHNIKPTAYDFLACLQKYDVGSFEDFCSEFGYEMYDYDYGNYNKESLKTYKATVKEYNKVIELFGDVIEKMREECV